MTQTTDLRPPALDETHDPQRRSWVESANAHDADFPLQNLPFCVFSRGPELRTGVAIGDRLLDLKAACDTGLLHDDALGAARVAAEPPLNRFMALGAGPRKTLRRALFQLLAVDGEGSAAAMAAEAGLLHRLADVHLHLPARIGGYTDFLTSRHHTERHGRLKGLAQPLPPACLSLPVAYNGRASSVRVSGHEVRRPFGQHRDPEGRIVFGPSVSMDFELELGAFIGPGNGLGRPVALSRAWDHLFGFVLLNDWSAKDIQWWEQVLGPFLGKSFLTSISPFIVTTEALAPFRRPATPRLPGDGELLQYLSDDADQAWGGLSLRLSAHLRTAAMREQSLAPVGISRTSAAAGMWTFGQMVTHHTSNGCNLSPGDLLGSGTLSGEDAESMGCITEMTEAGRQPLTLPNGEQRRWLDDGDEVTLTARAERDGFVAIGFGACTGRVVPAA